MRHTHIILFFLLLLCPALPMQAQHKGDNAAADTLSSQFVSNYDKLLNSYVMRRYDSTSRRKATAANMQSFDQVSDSLLARRLRSLHTVIPMTYNDVVRSYIRMYLNRMSTRMDVMLTLSEYYHPMFEESLARYDVPEEIKYLSIVESAMNPQAVSGRGAVGLWQFIYTTGKNNPFNGMPLPDIHAMTRDGEITRLTDFGYADFKGRLGSGKRE